MAFATRTIRDTVVAADQGGTSQHGTVVIALDHSSDSATSLALDASALRGHANGAKLSIKRIWWGLSGSVEVQFIGASADTHAIRLAGAGDYTGPAISNNATNTGATSGDLESIGASATGFIVIELRKDAAFTA